MRQKERSKEQIKSNLLHSSIVTPQCMFVNLLFVQTDHTAAGVQDLCKLPGACNCKEYYLCDLMIPVETT